VKTVAQTTAKNAVKPRDLQMGPFPSQKMGNTTPRGRKLTKTRGQGLRSPLRLSKSGSKGVTRWGKLKNEKKREGRSFSAPERPQAGMGKRAGEKKLRRG